MIVKPSEIMEPESVAERDMSAFYAKAFWWMMGLGASGIIASIATSVSLAISVGRLQVEVSALSQSLAEMRSASGDRYTSTTAAADKVAMITALAKIEERLTTTEQLVTELRIWRGSISGKATP